MRSLLHEATIIKLKCFSLVVRTHFRKPLSSRIQKFHSLSKMARKTLDVHSTRIRRGVFQVEGSNALPGTTSAKGRLTHLHDFALINEHSIRKRGSWRATMHDLCNHPRKLKFCGPTGGTDARPNEHRPGTKGTYF